ncbi:protein turtle-like [Centruroides vittatus]|uniref:protein turtle-like n=1 Tax=Centruroides vittatus TaxID=120091 RepID=UPI00350E8FB0
MTDAMERRPNLLFPFLHFLVCFLTEVMNSIGESADVATRVMGIAGGKSMLPCNITPPTQDDSVSLVLWYKDDSITPIYSLDARRGNLGQARHAATDSLSRRTYLITTNVPATLEMHQLSLEDEGAYRCRVDFNKARSRNSIIYLKIIVPPRTVHIKNKNGEVLDGVIGPYNEGDRIYLLCEAEGGRPLPSLTWWKNKYLLDDTYDVTPNGVVRNEMITSMLEREDLMATYTCQASNHNFSAPVKASVIVDVHYPPLDVKIEERGQSLSAQRQAEFHCKSTGSRPPAVISWYKGTTEMTETKSSVMPELNTTVSVMSFVPTIADTGKKLVCKADNPLIEHSSIEDTIKLDVQYLPQLRLHLGSNLRHSNIQEGNDVYFECNIRANPWVTETGWKFEDKELHTNTSSGVIVSNQSLVLQRVNRWNRGKYTCTATNTEGQGESNSVYLRVQHTPVCTSGQKMLYGAARHEMVQVECEVEADPQEVTFSWRHSNSGDALKMINFSNHGTKSIATYIPRTERDYGTLFCWGRNSVGTQKEPCVYTVIPAGPPAILKNCTVTNQTEDSIDVECVEGYDGGLVQHFIMEVYDMAHNKLRSNVTSDNPLLFARGLTAGTKYTVVIYSANVKGRSPSVVLTTTTLSAPTSLTQRDYEWEVDLRPIVAGIITVMIMLILGAFIALLVVRARNGRHDHKKQQCDRSRLSETGAQDSYDNCAPSNDVTNSCPYELLSKSDGVLREKEDPINPNPDAVAANHVITKENHITRNDVEETLEKSFHSSTLKRPALTTLSTFDDMVSKTGIVDNRQLQDLRSPPALPSGMTHEITVFKDGSPVTKMQTAV